MVQHRMWNMDEWESELWNTGMRGGNEPGWISYLL